MSQPQGPKVAISKIYVKDLSFESPSSPSVFQKQINPQIAVDVQIQATHLEQSFHEVVLSLTVEAKHENATFFIVEVEQAGVFSLEGADGKQQDSILKIFCPNVLFPYARQQIDHALVQGGFPALMMAPINFEQMVPQSGGQS